MKTLHYTFGVFVSRSCFDCFVVFILYVCVCVCVVLCVCVFCLCCCFSYLVGVGGLECVCGGGGACVLDWMPSFIALSCGSSMIYSPSIIIHTLLLFFVTTSSRVWWFSDNALQEISIILSSVSPLVLGLVVFTVCCVPDSQAILLKLIQAKMWNCHPVI